MASAGYGTGRCCDLYTVCHRDVPRAALHPGLPVSGPAPSGYSLARPGCPATQC